MDVHFIDIIFFAMVAAFLILRLRSVLGRRTGEERERLFRTQAERIPQFAEYEQKTERMIPVMILTPTKSG